MAMAMMVTAACGSGGPAGGGPDAGADPAGEHGTDDPVLGPASSSQVRVALAAGAGGYLAVWQDDRRDEGGDVFGARLSADGAVLDPVGLPLITEGGTQEAPRVASDGDGYLVVWTDWRLLGLSVWAARVDAGGVVLDPGGFMLGFGETPDVDFDGTDYVVVWARGEDVVRTRVSGAGEAADAGAIVCAGAGSGSLPSVAGALIAWTDRRGGAAEVRATTGADCGARIGDGQAARLAVASGGGYWAAWESGDDVVAARIDAAGAVLDAPPIGVAGGAGIQGGPAIAADGDGAVIAWHDQVDPEDRYGFDVAARRIDAGGAPAPVTAVADGAGQQARPFVLATPDAVWIGWDGDSVEPWDIFAAPLGGETVRVTGSANAQHQPRIARNRDQQLLVWSDRRDAPYTRTFAQHVEPDGAPRDEPVHALSAAETWAFGPALAEGDPSLVCSAAWHESAGAYGIEAVRIGTDRGSLDPAPIEVSEKPELELSPSVAFGGDVYLVVWEDQRPDREYTAIYAARVDRDGRVLDPDGILVSDGEKPASAPSVAYGDGVFLVAWERLDAPWYDVGAVIEVAAVGADGAVRARTELDSPDDMRDKTDPRVAFDGAHFLVVWELHLHTGWNIFATRVTPAAVALDGTGIAISESTAADGVLYIRPSVVFDGEGYVIGWQDEYMTEVLATRLGIDGVRTSEPPQVVSAAPLGQRRLDLAVTAGGEVTAAFERFDLVAGTWRVFQRRL